MANVKSMNKKCKNKGKLLFYLALIALPMIHFIIFYIIVNARSILYAFQEFTGEGSYIISFNNFKQIFASDEKALYQTSVLLKSTLNSFIVYCCRLLTGTGLGLIFSNYIYKKCIGHKFFQIMLFLPQIISAVVMATVLSNFLEWGIPNGSTDILKNNILFSGILFTTWTGFGVSVLMYTSTMSGIDQSIVESAQLDGITPVKEFIHITLPSIFPTLVSFIVIGLAAFFVEQESLYTLFTQKLHTEYPESQTMGYFIYTATKLSYGDNAAYAYLSALGLVLSAISIPITFGVKKLLTKYGPSVN